MDIKTKDPSDLLEGISGEVSVVGSMNADYTVRVDHLPAPGETVRGGGLGVYPGGKSSNQAVAAALLGCHVHLFGALGDDGNAEFLARCLAKAGVDLGEVLHVKGPSGATLITVDSTGENTIAYAPGANDCLSSEYVDEHAAQISESSVLGLCLESPLDVVADAAFVACSAGKRVLLNLSPFRADVPSSLLEDTDVLLVNEHELASLTGHPGGAKHDWHKEDESLRAVGIAHAIVTLGARGSMVFDDGALTPVSAVSVDAVDTTGCGDAYMGAILAGMASGYDLVDSAILASAVSAWAARSVGAQASYGSPEQVASLFK